MLLKHVQKYTPEINIAVKVSAGIKDKGVLAELFKKYGITEVVAINALPGNILEANPYPNMACGGEQIHEIAVKECVEWKKYLDPSIQLTGVGGVHSKETAVDFLRTGAKNIHIGSLFLTQDKTDTKRQIINIQKTPY